MARIKYSEEQEPIKKKHFGYTFIKNAFGESMMTAQRNRTPRTSRQLAKMQNLQKAVRFWRTMPPATKASWESFAATYPQTSKRFTGIPLTGYQLFLKRNHYCFLNAGILSDFMTLPELVSLSDGSPVFTLQAGLNTIDLTEIYIQNFGFIPSPGQWLIFAAVPYSEISGQFFPVINQSIQVLETYIDGFFLNIEMPVVQPNIVYSVYLSKAVHQGQNHKSSKVRYMGCFTTKSFLGLSDTPESYVGQAGKVATVNDDENAIVFAEAGGGGLSCEDLLSCPTIISMNSEIANLIHSLVISGLSSVPAIKYGYLYNWYAISSALLLPASGWRCATFADYGNLQTYAGGSSLAGAKLKEKGTVYWLTPNTGATNELFFNLRGGGNRSAVDGTFSSLQNSSAVATDWNYDAARTIAFTSAYNSTNFASSFFNKKTGFSVRLVKSPTTLSHGQFGIYTGNDGKNYRTVCIGTLEWLADNLAETKFRDLSSIPIVTNNASWAALTTPAMCAYNNDSNNV